MKSEEIMYQKAYVSPRPPLKISYKDNLMHQLDSEVAGSSKDTPTNPTKTKNPNYQERGQEFTKEIEKGTLFDHEDVKHSTRTGDPYVD